MAYRDLDFDLTDLYRWRSLDICMIDFGWFRGKIGKSSLRGQFPEFRKNIYTSAVKENYLL